LGYDFLKIDLYGRGNAARMKRDFRLSEQTTTRSRLAGMVPNGRAIIALAV